MTLTLRYSFYLGTHAARLALLAALLPGIDAHAVAVRAVNPTGLIGDQTSGSVVFTQAMVKLGDPSASAPASVVCTPAIKVAGRWADERTWTFNLERQLSVGERCALELGADLVADNGEKLTGNRRFEFFAGGPRPRRILPGARSQIDEEQVFVVNAGGPLDLSSLDQRLWCEAEGVGNRIGVRRLAGEQRAQLLRELGTRVANLGSEPLLFSCAERLPPGAKMRWVWGRGIASQNGARSEKEESFSYTVRAPFNFSMHCQRERADAPCSPLSPITLNFSAAVDVQSLQKFRLRTPTGLQKPLDPNLQSQTRNATLTSLSFAGPFAQNTELVIEPGGAIVDDAARKLTNAALLPLKVKIGALPPLAKFPGSFGILELKEGGVLPVTVRNLEPRIGSQVVSLPGAHRFSAQRLTEDQDIIRTLRALTAFEKKTAQVSLMRDGKRQTMTDRYYARELSFLAGRPGVTRRDIPKPGASSEFEVIGIPLTQPGLHIVEMESRLLGSALLSSPKPMYVRSAALVTNLAVHLKRGSDTTLVWVTTLDDATPVAQAEVRVSDCIGHELGQGKTDAQGRFLMGQANVANCQGEEVNFIFASARKAGDYSFVRSDWNEGLEPWRFGVETWGGSDRQLKIHTVYDRTLLRAGQTVSMKHIARGRNNNGFFIPPPAGLPGKLIVRDETGTEFSQPIVWDESGSATNTWKIPEQAKRGNYEVLLSGHSSPYSTEGFRVSDFRLPVFTGSITAAPAQQIAPSKVPLVLGLSFVNGGAAKGAAVQVSATLEPAASHFEHYDNFNFNLGFGTEARAAFGLDSEDENAQLVLDKAALTLDRAGAGKLNVPLPKKPATPRTLNAEMSFTDPNGEVQTLRRSVTLWPAAVALGIRTEDWASGKDATQVRIVALDLTGKPIAGQDVSVKAKRRVEYSHRRRIVGGFYAYENRQEYIDIGEVCRARTDSRGLMFCAAQIKDPGEVLLLAQTSDSAGNKAIAGASYWVSGTGDLWFTAGNQDRIDVIPEQRAYKAGDTARFQVRTPFRQSTVLVSVETGDIIETSVHKLSRHDPVIKLPVKAGWGPNVYVSVLAVRGRVQPLKWYSLFSWGWREPRAWFKEWWSPLQATAMVDLAKPAYRLGLAEIAVGKEGFELKVEVTPDKRDYQPRETATVRLKVSTPDGKPAAAGSEVAFAAVDQALLELRPNASWDVLGTMLQKRAYGVETATAQSQVIGKRHFGKKALATGGGGGRAPTRELFDTLLVWNPRVVLDASGGASVKVPFNDALSEFKLVGVATMGAGLFGTGSTAVRSGRDLQMISGLPPMVREKDSYSALLTLRNTTTRPMNVTVTAKAGDQALATQKLALEAGGAGELNWIQRAPENLASLVWQWDASEDGGKASDSLKITQQIAPAVPVTVQQATLARIDPAYEAAIAMPPGALPGKGGMEVGLSSRISTPPPGLKRFFETYAYTCLEQKTSVAIGLRDRQRWGDLVAGLPAYLDSNGLARYFPESRAGSVVLTAYLLDMAALNQASGFTLPEDSRKRLLAGLTAYVEGRLRIEGWSAPGSAPATRLAALEALTRQLGLHPEPERERLLTRSAAAIEVDLLRLPTSAVIDWALVVKRLADLPERASKLAAAQRELRNRLSYSGGRVSFTTEKTDGWWWMMISGDSNTFRLIEAMIDEPAWQEDLPRLVRGAMARQSRGHWGTTTANTWASVVLDQYGNKYERERVAGSSRASLGGTSTSQAWKSDGSVATPLTLPWPAAANEKLRISHEGTGKPWASIQVLAAIPAAAPRFAGYKVTRVATPIEEKEKGKVSRGDLWRVSVEIDAEQDMSWVVLSDPIPAGARILGDGDGRDSRIATATENTQDRRTWPTSVERSFGFYRAYYEFMPRGRTKIDYTVRINNAGSFSLPPTRVEAMYAPDIFGELPNKSVVVGH